LKRAHLVALLLLLATALLTAQPTPPDQVAQERATAEREVPELLKAFDWKPGMTIADVGAGGGAMTVVLARLIAPTRLFSTDIADRQLGEIRDYVAREKLTNVTVLKGEFAATNLPPACCDVIFMRNVYHHLRDPEAMMRSVIESLKPGGLMAIADFVARPGSKVPEGVRANRGGNGIPLAIVLEEVSAVGFKHVKTFEGWPPGQKNAVHLTIFRRP
jgi:predicted methyltransferase